MQIVVLLLLALFGCSGGGTTTKPGPTTPPKPQISNEEACEKGDGNACNHLGMQLSVGFGVEQDEARAATLYQKACELGDGYGCLNYAFTTEDKTARRERMQKGCDLKYGPACGSLATALSIRHEELPRALQLFQRACDLGVGEYCHTLANDYRKGSLGVFDASRAQTLYVRGCELEWLESCFVLGSQQEATDLPAAIKLFTRGCGTVAVNKIDSDKRPSGAACVALAAHVDDAEKARRLLGRGCLLGHEVGCMQLVRRLQTGSDGRPTNAAGALEVLQFTCEKRSSHLGAPIFIGKACDEAGMILRPTDPAAAAKLFQAACEEAYKAENWQFGDPIIATAEGCNHLARALERGEGLPKDTTAAHTARQKACSLKYQPACDYLRCSVTLGCTPVDP